MHVVTCSYDSGCYLKSMKTQMLTPLGLCRYACSRKCLQRHATSAAHE